MICEQPTINLSDEQQAAIWTLQDMGSPTLLDLVLLLPNLPPHHPETRAAQGMAAALGGLWPNGAVFDLLQDEHFAAGFFEGLKRRNTSLFREPEKKTN